jgi:hypothetical protein
MTHSDARRPRPRRWLQGAGEPIFDVLPESILANMRHAHSENALVWNCLYPRLWPERPFSDLVSLRPLWGTADVEIVDEAVRPFFWGYAVDGQRLPGLQRALDEVDGPGPQTEVDLFLLGPSQLILVEAKHTSQLGRCSRFGAGRCPEVHRDDGAEPDPCRYWDVPAACFDNDLDVVRPDPLSAHPACNRHYQLARTLRVGSYLAEALDRILYLWLVAPKRVWSKHLKRDWLDFSDRVKADDVWRRLRVLAWEDIERLRPN